jgi:glycosyltransferase involved in cell wall biosynthesis
METIGFLFDAVDLLVVESQSRHGGQRLPPLAQVVPLKGPGPVGGGLKRKISLTLRMPYYLGIIGHYVRQADAVHVPLPGDIPLIGMVLAILYRKRLIARYGGSWTNTGVSTTMNRITRALMRGFGGGRNVMFACGEGSEAPAPGVHWLFGTALKQTDLDTIRPRFERGLSDPPRIIYAGRLSPEKGVLTLIRAFHRLLGEGFSPLPRLTIAGDGPDRKMLESISSSLGCDKFVTFAGQLDRESLSVQFGNADFCVQPSHTESMGKVWLDAMAHGLPVLSSAVGSAAVVFGRDGERGWVVPPGDVFALAEALKRIIREPIDWPSLRRRCREYVEPRTLEVWGQRIGETCASHWKVTFAQGKIVA